MIWLQEWRTDGRIDLRIGRASNMLIAEWPGLGELEVDESGLQYRFTSRPELAAEEAVRHENGTVRALLRHVRGDVTLHASAVEKDGVALALLGESMSGKSTLVAELCRRPGLEMISDDTTFLERHGDDFHVTPCESLHWLREDAARFLGVEGGSNRKTALVPRRASTRSSRLGLLIALTFDDSIPVPSLHRIDGHEAFRWLRTSLFRLVLDNPDYDLRDFLSIAALYAAVPILEFRRPRFLGDLNEHANCILEQLEFQSRLKR